MRRRRSPWVGVMIGAGILLVSVAVLIGAQFATKSGIFRVPGVVKYAESVTEAERLRIEAAFTKETDLESDVEISAWTTLERPEVVEGEFITEILVPVTDFYSTATGISGEIATRLYEGGESEAARLISIEELDFRQRLLTIDDKYYLDDFAAGAVWRVIKFDSPRYAEEVEPLVRGLFVVEVPSEATVMTLAQTGVTALSRRMNTKMYEVGNGEYFAEKIGEFLAQFDVTHTSNESSFSEYASSENICSDARFINTLLAIGLDVVELTGNHNVDCGADAANETIDIYQQNGIKIVGGGKNATEATAPLRIEEKGNRITMLAFNESTGGATLGDGPGANQYYEEIAAAQIAEAKARGDFVIVDVQYYECNAYASEYEDPICDAADSAAGDQVGLFRHLIELGADVVVGTSAHQPQTFELYGNGVIFYGLGNLFFDQVWWPGTTRSLVLVHHLYKDKLLQTQIVPTVYDADMQTELMDAEKTAWFIERLMAAKP